MEERRSGIFIGPDHGADTRVGICRHADDDTGTVDVMGGGKAAGEERSHGSRGDRRRTLVIDKPEGRLQGPPRNRFGAADDLIVVVDRGRHGKDGRSGRGVVVIDRCHGYARRRIDPRSGRGLIVVAAAGQGQCCGSNENQELFIVITHSRISLAHA